MIFPLSLSDMSLLLCMMAIILLVTSELLSPDYSKANVLVNRKRLRNAAAVVSILFLATIAIIIFNIISH
jgi:hypothetical protein